MWSKVSLTVPLLRGHVAPVLAHGEDVLHQEAAVVFSTGCTAVGTLQHLRHVFQQLAALQTWPACTESESDCFCGQPEVFCTSEAHLVSIVTTVHSRLLAHRMKYLIKLHISAIFF